MQADPDLMVGEHWYVVWVFWFVDGPKSYAVFTFNKAQSRPKYKVNAVKKRFFV